MLIYFACEISVTTILSAALQICIDMVKECLITEREAIMKLDPDRMNFLSENKKIDPTIDIASILAQGKLLSHITTV